MIQLLLHVWPKYLGQPTSKDIIEITAKVWTEWGSSNINIMLPLPHQKTSTFNFNFPPMIYTQLSQMNQFLYAANWTIQTCTLSWALLSKKRVLDLHREAKHNVVIQIHCTTSKFSLETRMPLSTWPTSWANTSTLANL